MPAKTPAQRRLFGAALAAKRGAEPISKKVADIAKDVPEKELSKMASKPKKTKKENIEGSIQELYLVKVPEPGCGIDGMVQGFDPLVGLTGMELAPQQVHGVYHDPEVAQNIAEMLCKECMQQETVLEEKKDKTTDKIKKAIDQLEKKRKDHIAMVKEDPKNASKHRHHVAQLATKIDDLINKLEAIEKSKKAKIEE